MLTDKELLLDRAVPRTGREIKAASYEAYEKAKASGKLTKSSLERLRRINHSVKVTNSLGGSGSIDAVITAKRNVEEALENVKKKKKAYEEALNDLKGYKRELKVQLQHKTINKNISKMR